eukprot:jgi/Botrbrau1/1999/Bobra.0052s0040.1
MARYWRLARYLLAASRPSARLAFTDGATYLSRVAQRTWHLNDDIHHFSYPGRHFHFASLQGRRHYTSGDPRIITFPLPQTGEGIKECELIAWFVQEGQELVEFDKMCEVQSDKASVEITSRYSGTVSKLHASVGDIVQVGAPLLDIQVAALEAQAQGPSAVQPGRTADAGASVPPPPPSSSSGGVVASPAVRRIARENRLDLNGIVGSGPGGRITKEDLEDHIARLNGVTTGPEGPSPMESVQASGEVMGKGGVLDAIAHAHVGAPQSVPAPEGGGASVSRPPVPTAPRPSRVMESYDVPLRGYRRAMVKSLTAAAHVPHFHFCDEIRMDHLVRVRDSLRKASSQKLTFLPFIIKAISVALRQFPEVNSSLAEDASSLRVHASHNVGIAMDTPAGLVVPNIKGVEKHICGGDSSGVGATAGGGCCKQASGA